MLKQTQPLLTNSIINKVPVQLKHHFINVIKLLQGNNNKQLNCIVINNYTKGKVINGNKYHTPIKLSTYNLVLLVQYNNFNSLVKKGMY